jgi:predicted DNA-binding transcriptional regulator AlpA
VSEVAALTGFSRPTITRLFEREPGIIVLERPTKMNKRRYRSVRIPHEVYERVIRRLTIR